MERELMIGIKRKNNATKAMPWKILSRTALLKVIDMIWFKGTLPKKMPL
jgi:hypothetical protein